MIIMIIFVILVVIMIIWSILVIIMIIFSSVGRLNMCVSEDFLELLRVIGRQTDLTQTRSNGLNGSVVGTGHCQALTVRNCQESLDVYE